MFPHRSQGALGGYGESHNVMVVKEKQNIIIPHRPAERKMLRISSGGISYTFENLFNGELAD